MKASPMELKMKDEDRYSEWEIKDDCCTIEKAVALMADKKKWPKLKAALKKKRETLDDVEAFMRSAQKDA